MNRETDELIEKAPVSSLRIDSNTKQKAGWNYESLLERPLDFIKHAAGNEKSV